MLQNATYHAPFDTLPHDEQLQVLEDVARRALSLYGLSETCGVKLINLSENATYRIDHPDDNQHWALRVHRDGYHSRQAILSELAWQQDLRASKTIITPAPVTGVNGALLQEVPHPTLDRPRYVVLFNWESGRTPEMDEDLRSAFGKLGEVAARMHQHARTWRHPDGFERFTWDFDTSIGNTPHWGYWRDGIGVDENKQGLFARTANLIGQRLRAYGQSPDRFGLVHCDLRLANLLIEDNDTVKVIDFDDCGFSWFMYDAATTVSFYEHREEVGELIGHWLDGYRNVADLPTEDEQEIPTFIMLRRLLLVAWIGSHNETDLARSMGLDYTEQTVGLCEKYISRFG